MKRTSLILFAICFYGIIYAQNYDFGKVSVQELKENYYPLDSTANAAYLYKYRRTYFDYTQGQGFSLITEIHERVKIYNQGGFNYATKIIGLIKSKDKEEVLSDLEGYTYNLDNDKVTKTKLNKKETFQTDKANNLEERFTMPNVAENCVIEYKYTIVSPFYLYIRPFQFQYSIPVKRNVAKLESPDFFGFNVNSRGAIPINVKKTEEPDAMYFTFKNKSGINTTASETKYRSSQIDYSRMITEYSLSDVPALKYERYVTNIRNYSSAVGYELAYIKYPNSPIKHYATTWEKVVKNIYKNPRFGKQLSKTEYFLDDLKRILNGEKDAHKKADTICGFLRSKVKWDQVYTKYTSNEGIEKAYKKGKGNAADVNLMLTSMFRAAGLDANPVLVSSRKMEIPLFPSRDRYNFVVSAIKIDNKFYLFDATNKYTSVNVLPYKVLNWKGRLIKKDGTSQLIDLFPENPSERNITMLVNIDDSGIVTGKLRQTITQHSALVHRWYNNNVNKEEYVEKLEKKYPEIEISDLKIKNKSNRKKPYIESYSFDIPDLIDVIDDKIFFSPMFFLRTKRNWYEKTKRLYPIDFEYPKINRYRININVPKGYKVEAIPESITMALPDDFGTYSYKISHKNSMITLSTVFKINKPTMPASNYDSLRILMDKLVAKSNEQVLLIKN